MQYRKDQNGNGLSALGFGCMRFTRKGSALDIDKAEREIMAAFRAGVNYYDTAYVYAGSEALLGAVLARNGIRKDVNIATKLPHYMISSISGVEKLFLEELSRLQTDYVDYYLMHHLTDYAQWERLKHAGILDWIRDKKASGAIRNIGFSYHGNTENFLKILEDYDWNFCQIQYNYLDENTQAGVQGLKAAAARNIPVIIMEPLRGGKLVGLLPEESKRRIAEMPEGWTPAELALRWLWDQPEVTCVLSGMNSIDQVRENCRIAADAKAGLFTADQHELISRIREDIVRSTRIGCTECGYCQPCPRNVDIPGIFRCYNRMYAESKRTGLKDYFQAIALRDPPAFAGQCNGCGRCEKHCPQHIEIRKELKRADRALMLPPIRLVIAVARKYLRLGKH